MYSSVINSIGAGSGLNTSQLVNDLVAASTRVNLDQLNQRSQLNSTRISAMAATGSTITTFAGAVNEAMNGHAFVGDLLSRRTELANATVVEGARPEALPASVEVAQIATTQLKTSDIFASASDPI